MSPEKSEQAARWGVGLGGLGLVVLGVIATFVSSNGAGAAALVTVGSIGVVGTMLWTQIESATIGPVGIRRKAEAAAVLEQTGEAEQAEVLRSSIEQDLASMSVVTTIPKGQRRAYRLEDAVVRAFLQLGLPYQKHPALGTDSLLIRPDFTFETRGGKRVVVESTAPMSEASAYKLIYQRLLALLAADFDFDAYLVIASSPRPSINEYLRKSLRSEIDRLAAQYPNVTMGLIVVNEPVASEVTEAVSSWLTSIEPPG